MRQGAICIRAVALRAHRALPRDASTSDTAPAWDENDRQLLLSLLERDSIGDFWDRATVEMVSEAARGDESVRDLCLGILASGPGRPGTPGSRDLAWLVLLTAFPHDPKTVGWVSREIASDEYFLYNLAHAPAAWAEEPAVREAAQTRLMSQSAHLADDAFSLARLARTDQVRDHLINALDAAFGTAAAARALQHHYGDDPTAREALLRKVNGPADDAVPFMEVAASVLGPERGIDRLIRLIQQRPQKDIQHVIATLGSLWIDCKKAARGEASPLQRGEATRAIERHDARTLANLCLDAVPSEDFGTARGWIIGAWPEVPEVLAYARQCLRGASPEVGAVLIGYGPLASPEAAQIVAEATALLNPLPPALRALIAQQLTRRGIDAHTVIELLNNWSHDTSASVRRAAATALARVLAPTSSTAPDKDRVLPESAVTRQTRRQQALQRLRIECRQELLAHDPETGGDGRRTAWVIMLLLGDVTLLDGITERYDGRAATVELGGPLADFDAQLTELIATHWTALQEQCDNRLPERLVGRLGRVPSDLAQVWTRLANVAARHPDLDRALNDAVDENPQLLHTKGVFAWYADANPEDPRLLHYATQAAQAANDPQPVLHVVSGLRPVDAHRRELLHLLTRPLGRTASPHLISDDDIDMAVIGWRRIALARLLPDDPHTHSLYRKLQEYLASGHRLDWTWPEVIAVTINLAPAGHVPYLALRITERLQRRGVTFAGTHLLEATAHRIRRDPEAEDAMIAAITNPDTMDTNTAAWDFAGPTYTDTPGQRAHHQVLLAGILGTATGLPADVAAALAPLADSDSVLHDNPLMTPRAIRLAVLDLLDVPR